MADWPDFRPRPIIQLLTARGVDFVVIGGYAAVLHGSARVTRDLDVCYATDAANLAVLGRALTDMNARPAGVDEDVPFVADARTLARVELLTLVTDLGRLDVMTAPAGAPPYGRMRDRADRYDLDGLLVRVAAIPDLVAMKRAVGRKRDLADIEELEAIQRLRARAAQGS
jgi:predicted nucleotidyltransferase